MRHKLISKDLDSKSGECVQCGPVSLGRVYRGGQCINAIKEQAHKSHYKKTRSEPVYRYKGLESNLVLTLSERLALWNEYPDACQICKCDLDYANVQLDHCHTTGKFRGWLCFSCNTALGHFKDNIFNLRSAIEYLE